MDGRTCFQADPLAVIQRTEKNNMLLNEDELLLLFFGKENTLTPMYSLPLGETIMTSNNIKDLGNNYEQQNKLGRLYKQHS